MNTDFKDHFSVDSDNYATYRPDYPPALIDILSRNSPRQIRALNCGCGTGQLSTLLADRFNEVVATDASAAQIKQAQRHERVSYRVALAENSGLTNASVDLITVAQAAHWLNLEKFYAEARRVAYPGAAIALITYGMLHINADIDPVVQHFYHEIIGPYWPAERRHVENGYRNLSFPFKETQSPALAIKVRWRLHDLLGYIHTWSAVKACKQSVGSAPVEQFEMTLRQAWGNPETRHQIQWPLSLRLGHID